MAALNHVGVGVGVPRDWVSVSLSSQRSLLHSAPLRSADRHTDRIVQQTTGGCDRLRVLAILQSGTIELLRGSYVTSTVPELSPRQMRGCGCLTAGKAPRHS